MATTPEELRARTKRFAIRIVRLCRALPATREAGIIANQLLRCGTSVGANYRAACRARSRADFSSKMGVVLEEADETVFWLELLTDVGAVRSERLSELLAEANELVAIFAASRITATHRR